MGEDELQPEKEGVADDAEVRSPAPSFMVSPADQPAVTQVYTG